MKTKIFLPLFFSFISFAYVDAQNFKGESFTFEYCDGLCPRKEGAPTYFEAPGRRRIVVNNESGKRIAEVSFGASKNDPNNSFTKCRLGLIFAINDYKNRGIGTELFKRAIKAMAEDGCEEVEWTSYKSAVPFYKKMGVPDSAFSPTQTEVRYKLPADLIKKKSETLPENLSWFEKMKRKMTGSI